MELLKKSPSCSLLQTFYPLEKSSILSIAKRHFPFYLAVNIKNFSYPQDLFYALI